LGFGFLLLHHQPTKTPCQRGEEANQGGKKVFCGEEAKEKLLYLVLSELDEAWKAHKL